MGLNRADLLCCPAKLLLTISGINVYLQITDKLLWNKTFIVVSSGFCWRSKLCVCVKPAYDSYNTSNHPLIIVPHLVFLSQSRNSYPTTENQERFVCYAAADSPSRLHLKGKKLLHSIFLSHLLEFSRPSSLSKHKTVTELIIIVFCSCACCHAPATRLRYSAPSFL